MGTKLIIYVLLFDIILSLMVGAYTGIASPNIPSEPTQEGAYKQASAVVICLAIPSFTLIPSWVVPVFNTTVPAVQFPFIPLFSFNFGFMWEVFYVIDMIIWIFSTIFSVVGWLVSVFTGSLSLLTSVSVVGPFLTTFVLAINLVLIWELVKLIRGYGP
jgi:hypothetical protein